MPDSIDINTIIARELAGNISAVEQQQLFEWRKDPYNEAVYQALTNEDEITNGLAAIAMAELLSPRLEEEIWNRFLKKQQAKVRRLQILRYSAVACLVLLATAVGWHIINEKKPAKIPAVVTKEISPGGNKALLTIADGSTIALDSSNIGIIAVEENAAITNKDGELVYDVKGSAHRVSFNTLTTPKGGQYKIILPDGSKAWLNAASSIKYPVAFTGKERRVEVSGEVYFEVVTNTNMPFTVQVLHKDNRKREVTVLGTRFNINAYEDEPDIKTTLVEGRVQVRNGKVEKMMAPGQMTKMRIGKDVIETDDDAEIEQVIAWKNGYFDFYNCDLETVMRQISRWYDVEMDIDAQVPNNIFLGKIGRNKPLDTVLDVLRKSDSLDFQWTERKLRVSRRIKISK